MALWREGLWQRLQEAVLCKAGFQQHYLHAQVLKAQHSSSISKTGHSESTGRPRLGLDISTLLAGFSRCEIPSIGLRDRAGKDKQGR